MIMKQEKTIIAHDPLHEYLIDNPYQTKKKDMITAGLNSEPNLFDKLGQRALAETTTA